MTVVTGEPPVTTVPGAQREIALAGVVAARAGVPRDGARIGAPSAAEAPFGPAQARERRGGGRACRAM
ncbi:hypothetical protein [Sorangium sp. So ce1024]|uniref:hypothetical protein n=1 Tax=unclassified Sorangium TaxID=2621164 RepID=UPI003F03551C